MRASGRTSAWRGLPGMAAVVAAVVVLTGGMAWYGHRVSTTGTRLPQPGPGRHLDVELAYVGRTPAGPRLFTETHEVPDTRERPLTVAIGALMTDRPRDDDYRNYLLSTAGARQGQRARTASSRSTSPRPRTGPPTSSDAVARIVLQAMVRTVDQAVGAAAPVRLHRRRPPGETRPGRRHQPADRACRPGHHRLPGLHRHPRPTTPSSIPARRCSGVPRPPTAGSTGPSTAPTAWCSRATGRSAAGRCCELTPFTFHLPNLPRGSPYVLVVGSEPDLGDGGTTVDTKEFSIR